MRLNTATSLLALATKPAATRAFYIGSKPAATRAATSLAVRRPLFPVLRRSDIFFPDVDRMFEEFDEMDKMMENSLATFSRPSSLSGDVQSQLRRPLGFEVTQDDKEYKVAVHVPDMEVKDIDLQLDHDGRVLRLTGEKINEEEGLKVRSRFEKAILLNPDVDTSQLAANMSGDTLTVVAPKIDKKDALANAESKKIEINVVEPQAALQDGGGEEVPVAANMKNDAGQKATNKNSDGSWPVRDFPY